LRYLSITSLTSNQPVNAANQCDGGEIDEVSTSFYYNWSTGDIAIATVDSYGNQNGVGVGATTAQTSGCLQSNDEHEKCPNLCYKPSGPTNVTPTIAFLGTNNYIFDGSDPTVTPFNVLYVQGTPSGGTYSWSATSKSSYNPSILLNNSGSPYSTQASQVTVTADGPSSSLLDTTLTVNYSMNNLSAPVPATRAVTIRIFRFLQQSGNIQNIFLSGPTIYGITSYVTYNVYTNPSDQLLQAGYGGISVYESVSLTNDNFPVNLITASESTNANSQIVDDLSLTASSPLPSNFSATANQYLSVGGFLVRQNTLTYSASGPTITNLGPFS
jgi:hypothetical protein